MASYSTPRVFSFKATQAIAKGKAVKWGADTDHVDVCVASTDKSIGIAASAAVNAGDPIEVFFPGGGAKGLAQGVIAKGKLLTSHTDGSLKPVTGAGDRVIGIAMDDAVAADLFSVECIAGQASGVES